MNKKRIILLSSLMALILIPTLALAAGGAFDYTPMEQIPGFANTGNFYSYIGNVYKFGLWTVGICAMFMIGIGGYMYMISAGNSASMTKAKGVIFDAIAGLILALLSYLILFEINPNLVRLDGGSIGGGASTTSQSAVAPATPITGTVGGSCSTMKSQVPTQCGDASPALNDLLSCVSGKLGDTVQISSISDGNGGLNCYKDNPSWHQCPSSGGSNCCYHARTSCHYGGTCSDGSHAVDFSTSGSSASSASIKSAIAACNGKVNDEGNHIHGSIGSCCVL
jgi:hypothetical protein